MANGQAPTIDFQEEGQQAGSQSARKPTGPSTAIDFQEEAPPKAPPPAQEQPGFLNRFSEVTVGTQHPVEQAKSEWEGLKAHPGQSLVDAAKTAAMMPVNLAYNVVHHPIDTVTGITGGQHVTEDWENNNWGGLAGDFAGGLANAALLAKSPAGEGAAETIGSRMSEVPGKIGEMTRTEKGTLRPIVRAGSRAGGAGIGYAVGSGPGAVVGGLVGPSLVDAVLPNRPPRPAPLAVDKFGFPAGENPQPNIAPRYSLLKNTMPKTLAVNPEEGTRSSQIAADEATDVFHVPEPRGESSVETGKYMASIPRSDLASLAREGRPGAGEHLRNIGKTVIYTPPEGYPGPRSEASVGELPKGEPTPFKMPEFSSASRANLVEPTRAAKTPEWVQEQNGREILRLQRIMRDPRATAEEVQYARTVLQGAK